MTTRAGLKTRPPAAGGLRTPTPGRAVATAATPAPCQLLTLLPLSRLNPAAPSSSS
jgi:hypothetical protein